MALLSPYLILAVSFMAFGANEGAWSYMDPFEELFHPKKIDPTTTKLPPPQPSTSQASDVDTMRQIIQEELKKFQSSQVSNTNTPPSPPPPPPPPPPAAGPASASSPLDNTDLIRKIIADELAKALSSTPVTNPPVEPTTATSLPPQPVWKSWANTKYWAKKPGPDGKAPAGFIGTLQNRFGAPESAAAHPTGSPGWVWSQIGTKWAKKDDANIVPPSQVVETGNWEIVLPPQSALPAKS